MYSGNKMQRQLALLLFTTSVISISRSHGFSSASTSAERELNRYRGLIDLLINCKLEHKHPAAAISSAAQTTQQLSTFTPTTPQAQTTTSTFSTPHVSTLPPTTSTVDPQPLACQQAIDLDQAWRHESSPVNQKPVNGAYNCDPRGMSRNGSLWFRITGSAGNRLLDHCIPECRCGTYATLWSNATMPSDIGVSTTIPLYGSYRSKCDNSSFTCSVMKCSDKVNDYIYRWSHSDTVCNYGFCGMS